MRLLAQSTNQTWISADDIEWLVQWLSDEYKSGGVAIDDGAPTDGLAPNCAAPGVHIRWNFDGAWEAIILEDASAVAGGIPNTPQKLKSFVEKLTPEKWGVVDKIHNYGYSFGDATPEQRKKATFDFLENHIQRAVAKRPAAAE